MHPQKYTSADTCIKKINKIYTQSIVPIKPRSLILDYGGGKYDLNSDYIYKKNHSVVHVYDKYNRSLQHNHAVRKLFQTTSPDIIICSNVLNVIDNTSTMNDILKDIRHLGGPDTTYMFAIYEGNKSNVGAPTKRDCYQRNWLTSKYIPYINKYFTIDKKVGNLLFCSN